MTTVAPPILIQSRHPRARNDYSCHNCGGTIPKGTYYDESVVRIGTTKYKDPIQHWRMHSDCQAPWWQPWAPRKLTWFGAMPKRASSTAEADSLAYPIRVTAHHPSIKQIGWDLPDTLVARLYQSKRPDMFEKATTEIDEVLALVAHALTAVAGDRKRAMQLSHVLNEMVFIAHGVTKPVPRARKKSVKIEAAEQ